MAAGDRKAARRIAVPESGDINEVMWDFEPGDYCGPIRGYTGDRVSVFFMLPNEGNLPREHRGIAHVVSPPHDFRECHDGSLEIRESILCSGTVAWHGYLDEGNIWREV